MKLCVLGTGYVGLVAGACFSDSGNHVVCVDLDKEKVKKIQKGEIPIFEPGLDELVIRNVKANRLEFTTDASLAIADSQVVFIAVGTPSGKDGSLDLKFVFKAVETVKEFAKKDLLLVLKSTVPVGTAAKAREILMGSKVNIEVVSNPEFLKEGTAINDFLRPDRVVIGCQTEKAKRIMSDLYAPYVRSGNPLYFMDNSSAEMAKYAANAFLAMKISFINELAVLSEKVGADIQDVRKALVSDSRIGNKFLYAGCGYGGSCFPKDVQGLIHVGNQFGMNLEMFRAVHDVNEKQKKVLFEKINKHFKGDLKDKTVAIWGLSFKPMTDDMREAPSVTLINALLDSKCKVRAYDPVAAHEAKKLFENRIEICENAYEAVRNADVLAIMTEWNEFRSPDFEFLKTNLKALAIFDGRNLFNPKSVEASGLSYYCIGRPDPMV
ncbi:MAG: UDP-glucose/GDP-mannose dehydrogenase family protein [Bdellovibrionales bacterium]|nr:UDP-glucose/GDP-mannose dehydrogenase family protein [Bdellovibrionales bacterium]